MLLITGAFAADYSPAVRPDSDMDRFIRKVWVQSGLPYPRGLLSQPMHAGEVMVLLDSARSDTPVVNTPASRRLLNDLSGLLNGNRHLFSSRARVGRERKWSVENYINLSLLGDVRPSYVEAGDIRMKGIIRPGLSGALGSLSYYMNVDVWTEFRSDTAFHPSSYEPYQGIPYNLYGRADSGHVRSSDSFRAGIGLALGPIHLETAVDYLKQGPAVFYPLTLSGYAPPVTYLRGRMNLHAFRYIHTFGMLKAQKDKPKYMYSHRLEIPLRSESIVLAINETILNGSTAERTQSDSLRPQYYGETRDVEWVYLIPFVPFSFAEHYVGDRDNATLSFDLSVSLPKPFRWYAELFLDDITATIWTDDFGNKWALTLGGEYFGTVANRDLYAVVEYSRVEPWVYTHFYGGSHRYTHFDKSLGSPYGPNSDALMIQSDISLNELNAVGAYFNRVRTNSTVRGGSISDVFHLEKDSKTKEFLGKGTSVRSEIGALWRFNTFGRFKIHAKAGYEFGTGVALRATGGLVL